MSTDPTVYRHFRFQNPDGSSKDWAIGLAEDEDIRIRYGAKGRTVRLHTLAKEACSSGVQAEIAARINRNVRKGYVELGEATVNGRGRLEAVVAPPAPVRLLDWELRTPVDRGDVLHCLRWIFERMEPLTAHTDVEFIDDQGLRGGADEASWSIGYGPGGGLGDDGRGGGQLSPEQGALPVLVLLVLEREFPGAVAFADERAKAVKPRLHISDPYFGNPSVDFDAVVETATALELCLGLVHLNDLGDEQAVWF